MTNQEDLSISSIRREDPEEISLVDLWKLVAARKKLLFFAIAVTLLLLIIYMLIAKPVYKLESAVISPTEAMISELEFFTLADLKAPGISTVYGQFLRTLKSSSAKTEFFKEKQLIGYYTDQPSEISQNQRNNINDIFIKSFSFKEDKSNPATKVSFKFKDSVNGSDLLNQYIEYCNRITVSSLITDMTEKIETRKNYLKKKMASLETSEKKRSLDKVVLLSDALNVAQKLGIHTENQTGAEVTRSPGVIEVNTASIPLYSRGIEALEAELNVLKQRKSEIPYIKGYRRVEEEYDFLASVEIDSMKINSMIFDKQSTPPSVAENKKLILLLPLALVAGFFLGFLLIFFERFLVAVKQTPAIE